MKVAFICAKGFNTLIGKTVDALSKDYNVCLAEVSSVEGIEKAIKWADIVWFEFANEVAAIGTKSPFIKGKKVIVRLRSYELFNQLYKGIEWNAVNRLVFTASHVKTLLGEIYHEIKNVKSIVIENGFELENASNNNFKTGYDIAWVPNGIDHRKNPPMVLQIMKKLNNVSPQFKLHIAGTYRELRHRVYMEYLTKELGLQDNIIHYGFVTNMETFWQDKNYLLSTSLFESFGNNIFEAMIHNIQPVIHNFYGAKQLYPTEALFNTIDEAVNMIVTPRHIEGRKFVQEKGYTFDNQIAKTRTLIESLKEES